MSRRNAITTLLCLSLTVAVSAGAGALQAQAQATLTFTRISVAGAVETDANAIDNAGNIVGYYVDSKGVDHGFIDAAGKITTLNVPDSIGTRAYGISEDYGIIVGWYTDASGIQHGFEYTGTFTTIDVPGATWTRAYSVNTSGSIVGSYADSDGVVHGFLDRNGHGDFTTLDFDGSDFVEVHSINGLGYMVGNYDDASGIEHGVFGADGALVSAINFPRATVTSADGISDGLEIVGYFGASASGPFHGYTQSASEFHTVKFPGAIDTRCMGVNTQGDIVGRYTNSKGVVHGFVAK